MGMQKVNRIGFIFLISLMGCLLNACGGEGVVFIPSQVGEGVPSFASSDDGIEQEGAQGGEIYVHVCGAVNSPRLKKLPESGRVWDALEMADGFTEDADTSAVNLAAFLEDGQQIYFPTKEEVRQAKEKDTRIDLNRADEAELQTLPGIGSAKAQDILKYRQEHGSFENTEQLKEVPGISDSLYERIRDFVRVSD